MNIRKVLIIVSILLLSINYILYSCIPNFAYRNIFRIISLVLMLLSIVFNRKIKVSLKMGLLVLYLFIGFIFSSELHTNFLFLFLMSYGLSLNFENDKVTKYLFIICLGTLFIYLFLYFTHIINNVQIEYLGRVRNTLGFQHPNGSSVIFLSLIMLSIAFAKKYYKSLSIILMAFAIYITNLTDSRTLLLSVLIFTILIYMNNSIFFKNILKKIDSNRTLKLIVLMLVFAAPFLIAKLPEVAPKINILLSHRGNYLNSYINRQSTISLLFGFSNVNDLIVDNSFILCFYSFGIFGYLLIFKMIYNSFIDNNIEKNIFIFVILIFGTMESLMLRPECLAILYFWYIIFNDNFLIMSKRES